MRIKENGEEIELKRCPFCDVKAKLVNRWTTVHIECEACEAKSSPALISAYYSAAERAIKAWNTRAYEDIPC